MSNPNEWDTEEVLAFVHDVRPWRDMDQAERAEWCRRVKHIRDNVTTGGRPWTNARLGGLFGLDLSGLEKRFSRSGAISDPDRERNYEEERLNSPAAKEAAAKATAEAEARAQTALAAALAEQERKAQAQAEKVRTEAERAKREALAKAETEKQLAVQAETLRVAAQAKAEAEHEAKLKLEKIEKQLRAQIKAEPPTDEVLAEMAKNAFNSEDPDIVAKMAEAYGKHRAERDAKAKSDAKAQQAASRAHKAEEDAKKAAARASREYEDSGLFMFIEETYPSAIALDRILSAKRISASNVIASDLTEGQIRDMCDEVAEIAKRVESQLLETMMEAEVN